MLESITEGSFWIALLQIIGVNIVLSGDNAVVIALACRSLPGHQQKKAILFGSIAAIVMRIALTVVAVQLLKAPYLKLVGSLLLLWIGIKLLVPEEDDGEGHRAHTNLVAAVKTILVADLIMSLDNVIAVAAAAKDNMLLLILGLLISIPLIAFSSTLLLKAMERFPIIVTIGGALLGYVAGEMVLTDPATEASINAHAGFLHMGAPIVGVLLVITLGKWLAGRARRKS